METISLGTTQLTKNSGGIGGEIYAKVSMLTMTGNSSDNIRKHYGGSNMRTSIFRVNSAKIHGGAVYTETVS